MKKEMYHYLQRSLAKIWLDVNLQLTVIGVTGSYGKTSVVSAVSAVLASKYSVNKTGLNLDTIFNLPITILKTKIWNEVLVLEYGVDHIGEMDKHLSLVKPKIAVLTGITPVHADEEHFGSLENIIKEKRKLIDALPEDGLAIFNYDDEIVRKIGGEYSGRKIFYGTRKDADIWASDINISTSGTKFVIREGDGEMEVETGILGYPAVYSCLAAWTVGRELRVTTDNILKQLKLLKPLKGRFNIEPGPLGTILVNDSLRANLASTLSGLKSFAEFPGRKIAILGEMGEVGEVTEKVHREVGEQVAKSKIDLLIGIGPLTEFIVDEAKKAGMKSSSLFWAKDVKDGAEILKKIIKKDDILYLKASLLRHLERIILILNEEKINCDEVICHQYDQCSTCSKKSIRVKST